jgi:hypothetical protein
MALSHSLGVAEECLGCLKTKGWPNMSEGELYAIMIVLGLVITVLTFILENRYYKKKEKQCLDYINRKKSEGFNYVEIPTIIRELKMRPVRVNISCMKLIGRGELVGKIQDNRIYFNPDKLVLPVQSVPTASKVGLHDERIEELLQQIVTFNVPQFMDIDSTAEIIVDIENNSNETIQNVSFDFSDLLAYFDVEGTIIYPRVKPGAKLVNRVRIRPKKGIEGIIPVSIIIISNGITKEKDYKIKVGGTEIY